MCTAKTAFASLERMTCELLSGATAADQNGEPRGNRPIENEHETQYDNACVLVDDYVQCAAVTQSGTSRYPHMYK